MTRAVAALLALALLLPACGRLGPPVRSQGRGEPAVAAETPDDEPASEEEMEEPLP